jgi:putative transposase
MRNKLLRIYGRGHLHFITFSCYRRQKLLGTARARNLFVRVLGEVRNRYQFSLVGYVVMPEHVHLLIGEPKKRDPSKAIQALKQSVSRRLRNKNRRKIAPNQLRLGFALPETGAHFWQRRFYDFNVWSHGKKSEKLQYMHCNPVKRGLVCDPKDWPWSSYSFYAGHNNGLLRIDFV